MIVRDENEMLAFGAKLAAIARPGDIIALRGGLGAGKTTLARGLLSALGLEEEAPSPSFAIVQPYEPPLVRFPVAHIDLYRLEDAAEAEELALDELLLDSLLVIEWPERLGAALWPDSLILEIAMLEDGTRRLTATVPAAWKNRWPPG
ncbi:tRNA (adenosine(37)-N6)-threonylcarbamoyltransferase complex ATPase subunit type 1 TsaE [Rhizorhapis sp. SPR117]|uniref:tRNA (adenosine(37)-N6)-threonylcarbamoyltransferase complex ATPase subunit type 1 TsaE n=1 Tax=Rhizorhapis sp. SPR117 TaxID=2912611 RepID=UPI001F01340E|nr:tRNA (adenosine(37)-N6)-threonylcarbamoyltransferase complex ATPase subunit type 1 TsaE [Rhizorhapis sp. SPR117]